MRGGKQGPGATPPSIQGRLAFPCVLAASLFFAGGCAALLAGGAAGTLEGFQYSYGRVARKTFTVEIEVLKNASVLALKEMGIDSSGPVRTEEGFRISAATSKLKIQIEIEPVTSRASQIKVNAKKGYIQKDFATAAEIVRRTESAIDRMNARTATETLSTKDSPSPLILLVP